MKKKVVVIGAGLAGSLICNELAKDCKVTLLEKGNKDTIQFPKIQFKRKRFAEVPTFCFGGGGTTNLWHNGLIPINTNDITSKYFRDLIADAQPYMNRAAAALFFTKKSFLTEYQSLVEETNELSTKLAVFPHGMDCLIYPKKYHKLKVNPKINDIYNIQNISFAFEEKKIKAVTYLKGGQQETVDTDYAVIAAGALGTPGILQKILAGFGISEHTAGLGFIDHPLGFVGKIKFKKNISRAIRRLSFHDKGTYISRSAVRLKSDCNKYTACIFFRPALTMANNLSIYKYKSLLGAGSGINRMKNIFSLKLFHPDILAEIFAHIFGVSIPGRTFNIFFVAEQKRANNRVYYEGNELNVDWSISDEEISIYRGMLCKLKDMLSELADKINIETGINENWLWSGAHHSGTTPMGGSIQDLIDNELRLKLFKNVFVCDGSVIQEHSYANTGLTIGQLALRLAKRIQYDGTG